MSLCTNQVKYLVLLENVRVRRAGFAYRQTYERFLHRFKMVSNKTWPKWNGNAKDGVQAILKDCNIDSKGYELGVTKGTKYLNFTSLKLETDFFFLLPTTNSVHQEASNCKFSICGLDN
jgi:hypothetical protein